LTAAEIAEIPGLSHNVPAAKAKLAEGQAGQSDLAVGARSTRKLGVQLSNEVRHLLRLRGRLALGVLAETGREYVVSDRANITVALHPGTAAASG
jgi:hypothetical protein